MALIYAILFIIVGGVTFILFTDFCGWIRSKRKKKT